MLRVIRRIGGVSRARLADRGDPARVVGNHHANACERDVAGGTGGTARCAGLWACSRGGSAGPEEERRWSSHQPAGEGDEPIPVVAWRTTRLTGIRGGPEAFAKAKAEDKPIFLSVGYSSCYWCHVMERESFMDPEIAKALKDGFVAIKVDREERPGR